MTYKQWPKRQTCKSKQRYEVGLKIDIIIIFRKIAYLRLSFFAPTKMDHREIDFHLLRLVLICFFKKLIKMRKFFQRLTNIVSFLAVVIEPSLNGIHLVTRIVLVVPHFSDVLDASSRPMSKIPVKRGWKMRSNR